MSITKLRREETVVMDQECLTKLYVEMGDVDAEEYLCNALEELAVLIFGFQRLYREKTLGEVSDSAREIAKYSAKVGMLSVEKVAYDVIECLHGGDTPAMAATIDRLVRVGDKSLLGVWDQQDLSV
ncbi:hypothetical protein [Cochlodiniinecator piscidefendens]|uniref:hypothetical protein n=1 Tax=Cochlodiniinecator piscidefendens TaxID=2715756 RepID=UPI00140A544C|nr:hypothetical protein [Cochlodiniinecator piscidefendens]